MCGYWSEAPFIWGMRDKYFVATGQIEPDPDLSP